MSESSPYNCPTCGGRMKHISTNDGTYWSCVYNLNHKWQEPALKFEPYAPPPPPPPTPRGTMIAEATRELAYAICSTFAPDRNIEGDNIAVNVLKNVLAIAADPRETLPPTYHKLVGEVREGRKPLA